MVGSLPVLLFLFMAAQVLMSVSGAQSAFTFTNRCQETVWPGVVTGGGRPPFPTTGFELQPGTFKYFMGVPSNWSGHVWARHNCVTYSSGVFECFSGECGTGEVECQGFGGEPPVTLVQFTLGADGGTDSYDINIADGFNVPVMVIPSSVPVQCATAACPADINAACPQLLTVWGSNGDAVGCKSACLAFNKDEFCCRGAFGSPDKCSPSKYTVFFKERCPQAYTYAYDNKTSTTFTCHGAPNYHIIFCP